jgi:DNA-directed RNA polymerase specialized sigma24 family protein
LRALNRLHYGAKQLLRSMLLSAGCRRINGEAIVLHDVAGYSSQEIAQLDGLQHNTVRTRLFRARRAMRRSVAHLLNSATSDTARSG